MPERPINKGRQTVFADGAGGVVSIFFSPVLSLLSSWSLGSSVG